MGLGIHTDAQYGMVDATAEQRRTRLPPSKRMPAIQLVNDILRREKLGTTIPWSTITIQRSPPDIRDDSAYYLVLAPKGALQAFLAIRIAHSR